MRSENIEVLTDLYGKRVTLRSGALDFARTVCKVMDAEGINDKSTAMFTLLDRAQMRAQIAARDWESTESSRDSMARAREYLSIAIKLARSGQ